MDDIRETSIDHVAGENYATLFTSERKWINYIYKLKESHPDEVDIRHVNNDGSLIAHIPASWMKVKPKKKVVLTEEQIEASKARLERGRQKRLSMIGDDAHVSSERSGEDEDSKRHHYYATEHEGMMRAIADTNYAAANIVAQIDKERALRKKRAELQGRKYG